MHISMFICVHAACHACVHVTNLCATECARQIYSTDHDVQYTHELFNGFGRVYIPDYYYRSPVRAIPIHLTSRSIKHAKVALNTQAVYYHTYVSITHQQAIRCKTCAQTYICGRFSRHVYAYQTRVYVQSATHTHPNTCIHTYIIHIHARTQTAIRGNCRNGHNSRAFESRIYKR